MVIRIWRLFILGSFLLLGCVEGMAQSLTIGPNATLTLNDGELSVDGTVSNEGTLEIEKVVTLVSDFTNAGSLNFGLHGSTTPGVGHDQLIINGSSALGGTLNVSIDPGYTPDPEDQFVLLTCDAGCADTFAIEPTGFEVTYEASRVFVRYPGEPPLPPVCPELRIARAETDENLTFPYGGKALEGASVAYLGKVNNTTPRVAVGVPWDGRYPSLPYGTVLISQINASGLVGDLDILWPPDTEPAADGFGRSIAVLEPFDGNNEAVLAISAPLFGSEAENSVVWIYRIDQDGALLEPPHQIKASDVGAPSGFGWSVTVMEGFSHSPVLAVGNRRKNNGNFWLLFLDENDGYRVTSYKKIVSPVGSDYFGVSLASLGDLRGDGTVALAVGAPAGTNQGGPARNSWRTTGDGFVWLYFFSDGSNAEEVSIVDNVVIDDSFFEGQVVGGNNLGYAVANVGDLDGDAVPDLAIGDPLDSANSWGFDQKLGALWIVYMQQDNGYVKCAQKISESEFVDDNTFFLTKKTGFGISASSVGDLDQNGKDDLIVGRWRQGWGAVTTLSLTENLGSKRNTSGVDVYPQETSPLPDNYNLAAYPNPFNPVTTIEYALPEAGPVHLVIYDVLGREVAVLVDGVQAAGRHRVQFEASDLPSGVYLYRLEAGRYVETSTMTLLR